VYVQVVKEDQLRRGLVFAGTERGAFVSFDDGDHWQPLQRNLPVTSVRDFVVYGNDLIVATHGRGFWVMDDISALRQVSDQVLQADAGSSGLRTPSTSFRATTTAHRSSATSRRRRTARRRGSRLLSQSSGADDVGDPRRYGENAAEMAR